jgi:acyl-CoA thioester hydrolase
MFAGNRVLYNRPAAMIDWGSPPFFSRRVKMPIYSSFDIEIRVRYQETDGQGRVHHANFITYFEQGRTELLRASGRTYRQLEAEGLMLVVAEMSAEYLRAARYDDLLRVRTTTGAIRGARIEHFYEVYRDDELLVRGRSVVACIDREGRPRRVPRSLYPTDRDDEVA